jgi:hypothetical protein
MEPGAEMPEQMGMNLDVGKVTNRPGDPFTQMRFAQGLGGRSRKQPRTAGLGQARAVVIEPEQAPVASERFLWSKAGTSSPACHSSLVRDRHSHPFNERPARRVTRRKAGLGFAFNLVCPNQGLDQNRDGWVGLAIELHEQTHAAWVQIGYIFTDARPGGRPAKSIIINGKNSRICREPEAATLPADELPPISRRRTSPPIPAWR